MTTNGACFLPQGYITMLGRWDWRSMFLTSGIYYQPLTGVLGRWQLTENVSYLRNTLPCSDRCHQTMATDGACFIREGYHNALTVSWQRWELVNVFLMYETCQLSSSHDNGQSMVMYYSGMKHAPPVYIVSWQRSGHGCICLKYETCSVSCHRLMTTDRAWLFIP